MNYYRLIFKVEDGRVMFSDIIEQQVTEEEFESMVWDKPIIRHNVAGHTHFISLDRDYLDSMVLGILTYQDLTTSQSDSSTNSSEPSDA